MRVFLSSGEDFAKYVRTGDEEMSGRSEKKTADGETGEGKVWEIGEESIE